MVVLARLYLVIISFLQLIELRRPALTIIGRYYGCRIIA